MQAYVQIQCPLIYLASPTGAVPARVKYAAVRQQLSSSQPTSPAHSVLTSTCSANYSGVVFLHNAAAVRNTQPIQPAQLAQPKTAQI